MAETITDGSTLTNFVRLEFEPQKPHVQQEFITQPYKNGVALRKMGSRSVTYTIRGLTHAQTASQADGILGVLNGYVGKLCSVSKGGVTYSSLHCLDCRPIDVRRMVASEGGVTYQGVWRVEVEMDFVYGAV